MIQSKYKFTSQIGIEASKVAFKTKSKRKEVFLSIAVPIALFIMLGVLIYDINKKNSIILDVVLIVMLIFLVVLNLVMPVIIASSQKKYLLKLDEGQFDYFISEYDKGKFKEKIYKDNKMLYCNEVSLDKLMSYKEFELNGVKYFLVLFNNYASLVFDTTAFVAGNYEELLLVCANTVAENSRNKRKK